MNVQVQAVNSKGLPILPDELYLEIISYYPVTPIPRKSRYTHHDPNIDVQNQNIRRQVLFALSQTSVNLRGFFLPYLWQRIEVCKAPIAPMKSRVLALELVRQLEIVTIRNPTLAKYVEIVNVEIGSYSRLQVIAELARCLALFPNLHTIQLNIQGSPYHDHAIGKLFKGYRYPSICTAILSDNAWSFHNSCPHASPKFLDLNGKKKVLK